MAGEFHISGFAVQREATSGSSTETESPLTGLTGNFVSNIPDGTPIGVDGGLVYVPKRGFIIGSNGAFYEVLPDGSTSTLPGINLTADDPAFGLGAPLQWQYVPDQFAIGGQLIDLTSFWFNAEAPGWTGTLDDLTPAPGVDQPGGTRGPRGYGFAGFIAPTSTTIQGTVNSDAGPVPVGGTYTVGTATWAGMVGKPVTEIDFVADLGAVADGQIVDDGHMNQNSFILTTTTTTPFTAGDVGKQIKVSAAGTGGADIYTTIASYQSSSQVTLNVKCNNGTGIDPAGVIWGTDNGPKIQAALDLLATNGGGTLKIPKGQFCILTGGWFKDFTQLKSPHINITGLGTESRMLVSVGLGNVMCNPQNAQRVTVGNVAWIGLPVAQSDGCLFKIEGAHTAIFRENLFLGLSVGETANAGVIQFRQSDLRLIDNQFHGCSGSKTAPSSVVMGSDIFGIQTNGNEFFDWGDLGGTHEAQHAFTAAIRPEAWIQIQSYYATTPLRNAQMPAALRFTNDRYDECCKFAIELAAGAPAVVADGCSWNVANDTAGGGIMLRGAASFLGQNLNFAWRSDTTIDAITLVGVAASHLKNVTTLDNTTQISADSTCGTLIVEDSPTITTINSSAAKTEIRKGGGPVTPNTCWGASAWGNGFNFTTLTANTVYYAGIGIAHACTITGIVLNGGTGTGNNQVALYNAAGAKVASSAAAAHAGGLLYIAFATPVKVSAGRYYIALQPSASTLNYTQATPFGGSGSAAQGSFVLPSTITVPTFAAGVQMPVMATY